MPLAGGLHTLKPLGVCLFSHSFTLLHSLILCTYYAAGAADTELRKMTWGAPRGAPSLVGQQIAVTPQSLSL